MGGLRARSSFESFVGGLRQAVSMPPTQQRANIPGLCVILICALRGWRGISSCLEQKFWRLCAFDFFFLFLLYSIFPLFLLVLKCLALPGEESLPQILKPIFNKTLSTLSVRTKSPKVENKIEIALQVLTFSFSQVCLEILQKYTLRYSWVSCAEREIDADKRFA